MAAFRVGVQLHPQHTTVEALRGAWRSADRLGFDTIWVWDHFFPLAGDPQGPHFEAWTLLAAMAVETERARLGVLVSANGYRNPDLLADMACTVDHLSGGRAILGLGAGWFERDHTEYGYGFGSAGTRIGALEAAVPRVRNRLAQLCPPPLGDLPVLIGGSGPKRTLKLVAEHADIWNMSGPPEQFGAKNQILDEWCQRVGRNPSQIERTVLLPGPGAFPSWTSTSKPGLST